MSGGKVAEQRVWGYRRRGGGQVLEWIGNMGGNYSVLE